MPYTVLPFSFSILFEYASWCDWQGTTTIMEKPNFYFERKLWKRGFKHIGGVDEVGRGCFAGPVVAAAVAFAPRTALTLRRELRLRSQGASVRGKPVKINDSKKLTARQREKAAKWIKENALTWGIGEAKVAEINRLGMGAATLSAFRRAVSDANKHRHLRIEYLLIDAFYIPYIRGFPIIIKNNFKDRKRPKMRNGKGRQLAIINGDEKSITIGAASIIAKVYRDKLMRKLSKNPKYKNYGWGKNKGYGTKKHQEAIRKYGITNLHRKTFVDTFLNKDKISNQSN